MGGRNVRRKGHNQYEDNEKKVHRRKECMKGKKEADGWNERKKKIGKHHLHPHLLIFLSDWF
jgi:hypothetical protein